MASIMQVWRLFEARWNRALERFSMLHPYLSLLATAMLAPILLVEALLISTTVIMYPLACLVGWL